MKSTKEIMRDIERMYKNRYVSPELLVFFQNNEEEIQSLLSKLDVMKMNMTERMEELESIVYRFQREEEGRQVRVYAWTPIFLLHSICECEVLIEKRFEVVIVTLLTPQGWRFEARSKEFRDHPKEPNNQRTLDWFATQAEPLTFPFETEACDVAPHLERLIENARAASFPLPEEPAEESTEEPTKKED